MGDELTRARRVKLKALLSDLRIKVGSGTELVTLIIPPDRQISDARGLLQNEHGQAANIKSKSTKKNVQAAIESAISALAKYKKPGENGLAIFVGAVKILKGFSSDGKPEYISNKTEKFTCVIDDPPQPFISFRYRCDSKFEITQLESMLVERDSYGLFVIDRSEAAYGIAIGKNIHIQEHLVSNIMGKHRQGGQSAQRFERLIEEAAHNFFKRATEHASSYWLPNLENIKAIIIGGPGATKDFVVKNDYFHHEIQKKLAKTHLDVGYSNESGIRELVQNAGQLMGEIQLDNERQQVNEFLEELLKSNPKATYGAQSISDAIKKGAVEKILISEKILSNSLVNFEIKGEKNGVPIYRCLTADTNPTHDCEQSPAACKLEFLGLEIDDENYTDGNELMRDAEYEVGTRAAAFIADLEQLSRQTGVKVGYISDNTEEGAMLLQGFNGIAALLRYPLY